MNKIDNEPPVNAKEADNIPKNNGVKEAQKAVKKQDMSREERLREELRKNLRKRKGQKI